MKRNDFATYIVYLGMIAIALLVGFLVVRPILSNWSSDYGLLTVILSVLGGAILNSVLLELGHLLGAKAGHYNVYGWTVLGLSFKKDANGKTKVGFSNFEGLTGETKMAPKDIEKATSSGVILLPLVLFLVEVVGGRYGCRRYDLPLQLLPGPSRLRHRRLPHGLTQQTNQQRGL